MKDYLVQCRVGCLLYFFAALVSVLYLNWPLVALFFALSAMYQVSGFIIQEIRNARI